MSPDNLRQNLEIKARVSNLDALRVRARGLASDNLGNQRQRDTYFRCTHGRLKLREIQFDDGTPPAAQLIAYQRPDVVDTATSHYRIVPVADGPALRAALQAALGIVQEVVKQREIYLHENVRIHLDQVDGLGTFVELEAVQHGPMDSDQQGALMSKLQQQLHITHEDLLAHSYCDLLVDAG